MKKTISVMLLFIMFISMNAQINIWSYARPSCNANDSTSVIHITATGGTPPYTYSWSGPVSGTDTSNTIPGLPLGSYLLRVDDALGAFQNGSINIIPQNVRIRDRANCDDTTTLYPSFYRVPVETYTYLWSDGSTNEELTTALDSTDYWVTITDPTGCIVVSDTINTGKITDLELSYNILDLDCNNGATVQVDLIGDTMGFISHMDLTVGAGPFDGGGHGPPGTIMTHLGHGAHLFETYLITSNSIGDCLLEDTINIDFNSVASNYGFGIDKVLVPCSDTIYLEPGLAPAPPNLIELQIGVYDTYEWISNNGPNSYDAEKYVNDTGIYSLFVENQYGCIVSNTVTIDSIPTILNTSISSTPATCNNNGSVRVIASGATPPYDYFWSNGGTTDTMSNLPAGNYTVTVISSPTTSNINGCMDILSVTVQGSVFQMDSIVIVDATCGASNGSAALYPSGTNGPFTYNWGTGSTSSTGTNLVEGFYSVTVTDNNGCSLVEGINIGVSDLQVITTVDTFVDCVTNTGGVLSATPLNGTAPYSYIWSNGDTTAIITGLSTGGYTVTVTDANLCSKTVHKVLGPAPYCSASISGQVYIDTDLSCSNTTGDIGINGHIVMIEPGFIAYTDQQGFWHADVNYGQSYQVFLVNDNGIFSDACGIDTLLINVPDTTSIPSLDLPKSTTSATDLSVSLATGPTRPGFTTNMYATICNLAYQPETISGSIVLDSNYTSVAPLTLNGIVIDSISSTAPYTVYYSYTSLPPQACITFSLVAELPTIPTVNIGQLLNSTATISATLDVDTTNNTAIFYSTVTGAYDPNDKQVFSNEQSMDGLASPADTLLEYLIRFQNTGNDTAFNVVIRDTLDQALDPATFRVLGSSHPVYVQFYNVNIVHFNFYNILLPDSNVNEPGSHGFVAFEIEIDEPGLLQPISNQAAIYFDYNPPIYTNTVRSTPAEIPMITGATELCDGETLVLRADTLSEFSYIWTNNGTPVSGFYGDSLYVTTAGDYSLALILDDDTIWSASKQVTINSLPSVSLTPALSSMCEDASTVSITVSPTGGTLTGDGVSGTSFDPATAGVGAHQLTYEYTDGNNCSATAYETVTVDANPTATLSAASNSLCEDASAVSITVSPTGGTLTGDGVSGTSFDPATAGVGAHQLTYEYTDGNNCSATAYETVTVNATPTATLAPDETAVCEDAALVAVTVSPSGGALTGTGVTGTDFDPASAGVGTHTIDYLYTDGNGCSNAASATIVVTELPAASLSLPSDPFCKTNDPIDLSSYIDPVGGVITSTVVSGTMLDASAPGTYAIEYTYTDNNGCAKTAQASIVVDECIGIEEVNTATLAIYPNPTTGLLFVSIDGNTIDQIELYDMTGQQLQSHTYGSVTQAQLNMNELANGMYMLRVNSGNTWHTERVVLQR